jgi:hypothetical protein
LLQKMLAPQGGRTLRSRVLLAIIGAMIKKAGELPSESPPPFEQKPACD